MAGDSNNGTQATANPPEVNRLWAEWGRLTRFLESARIALARERERWTTLELVSPETARITAPTATGGRYTVGLEDHLKALADEEILCASILIHSYALVEDAAADRLDLEQRDLRGIELWGTQLLESNARSWDDVEGGLRGAVATAVIRNAYSHGDLAIDPRETKRLNDAGMEWTAGMEVHLNYGGLRTHRKHLRSLLHEGGLGGSV